LLCHFFAKKVSFLKDLCYFCTLIDTNSSKIW